MNFGLQIILLFLHIGNHNALNFENRDQTTGLTFIKLAKTRISYDTYTILYFVDISQYKNITVTIEKFLIQTELECKRLKSSNTCEMIIEQAKTLLTHMKRDEIDIQAYQQKPNDKTTRKRRAIEFVGDFYHWAFGLMNAATAREYEKKVENSQFDEKRLHNLAEEQTILIKESIITNNKTYNQLTE